LEKKLYKQRRRKVVYRNKAGPAAEEAQIDKSRSTALDRSVAIVLLVNLSSRKSAMEAFEDLPNLASPQLGARVVFATDEWFAACDNMLNDAPAEWKADLYTPFGKWMDGWESRRRRTEGHDWCIIQLGLPCIVHAIEVDTAHFTGNFSPKVSIHGANFGGGGTERLEEPEAIKQLLALRASSAAASEHASCIGRAATEQEMALANSLESDQWSILVPLQPLGAGYEATRRNYFFISSSSSSPRLVTHLRVNMGPDGGIARLRVHGQVIVSPSLIPHNKEVDLAAVELGGRALGCSNKHYGHPRNLIAPGRGSCMGDGWETARQPKRPPVYQRGEDGLMVLPGSDWAVLQLGVSGIVSNIEVDTHFYKGNYPESCLVEACFAPTNLPSEAFFLQESSASETDAGAGGGRGGVEWKVLLPRTRLGPNVQHFFPIEQGSGTAAIGPISHVRISIYPDGGVMRLRVMGKVAPTGDVLSKL